MNNIDVSVIMGVFNPKNKKHLLSSVNSIKNQTFSNWEMLVYDDGSDEKYIDDIKDTIKDDSRIAFIRCGENKGLSFALNECIKRAKGNYIARMDDDDISYPKRLEKLYDFLENNLEYAWVGSNADLIDDNNVVWGERIMKKTPNSRDFLLYSPYIHPSVMFRKKVLINENGYKVSKQTRRCEDYELFMRLYKKGYRGYNIQEKLLQYREDENSYKKRKLCYRFQEMKIRKEGFNNLGILNISTFHYVLRPIAASFIPKKLIKYMKRR